MANEVTQPKTVRPAPAPARTNGAAAAPRSPAALAPAPTPTRVQPVRRMSGFAAGLMGLVLLVLIVAGAWAAYHYLFHAKSAEPAAGTHATGGHAGHHGHGGDDVIRVVPATVARGDIGVYLIGLGAVTPYNTVTIQARVSGQLMKVDFTDGQAVKVGTQLVQIDDRPYRAQLEQYLAQKEHDEALLDNAKIDEQRYETLWKQQSIPQQTLATQQATVKQDQGTVDSDQAQVDQTQLNIDYCNIKSPIDGVVGLRLVDVGNQVFANQTNLLVVNQVQPVYVDFTIPEDNVPAVVTKLKSGQALAVAAFDRNDKTKLTDGKLLTTDNQIDPQTGTLKLRSIFDNTDGSLFPNQFVNAKLLLETKTSVVIAPVAAIQYGTQGTFVYTIDETDPKNATVNLKMVQVGTIDGDRAEITGGLNEGDRVVVDGVDKLGDKTKVVVQQQGDATGAGAKQGHKGKAAPTSS